MSKATSIIERVLNSNVLLSELVHVAPRGATAQEIASEEKLMTRALSPGHREILAMWNGANLDVIRLFCCGPSSVPGVRRLSAGQEGACDGEVFFADDPAGFRYVEGPGGAYLVDADGGSRRRIAENLDDLFTRVVFGRDAASFGGPEWEQELRDAGLF